MAIRSLRALLLRALGVSVAASVALSCSGPTQDAAPSSGALVVGVTSDLTAGVDIARLRVIMRADGRVLREETRKPQGGDAPLALPTEIWFRDLPGGTKAELSLEVYKTHYSDEEPLIRRDVATHIVTGHTHLLRARIERECIPSARLTSDLTAPTCDSPLTCVGATCVNPYVSPEALEEYASTWADSFADACKPAEAGAPIVEIGEGKEAFEPLPPGGVMQVEAGPQGGYHVWVSVRMKNLHQAGARTSVDIYPLKSSEPLATSIAIQSYGSMEGGYCELLGVRCQLTFYSGKGDQGVLGETFRLAVKVADVTGDVGIAEQLITLSEDVAK